MKKCFLLPTVLFPYALVVTIYLYFGFFGVSADLASAVRANFAYIGCGILGFWFLSVVMNIVYMILRHEDNSSGCITAALLVKCLHIPTYFLIFIFGLLLGTMFFMTTPLIIFLIFLDFVTLWLSNMISIHAIVRAMKRNKGQQTALLVVALICQFFFCADIISLLVLRILWKKDNA